MYAAPDTVFDARYNHQMALERPQPDPVDEEVARLLADPAVRKRLDDVDKAIADGSLKTIPNEEVRRRLGLDAPTDSR